MFTHQQLTLLLASIATASALHASLRTRDSTSPAWTWANDPTNCKTDACLSDCQAATAAVCASSNLGDQNDQTVGDCTAFYYYQAGNTVPTAAQCNAAYAQLTGPPSTAGSPNDCPGYVGGALGWDSSNKRTNDPVYMVYPKAGNGHCMKAPGDTSPVAPLDVIPNSNGKTIPPTCPTSTSRRKRAPSSEIEARGSSVKCELQGMGTGAGCSAGCVAEVTLGGWEFGPFVAVGWLACSGICLKVAMNAWHACETQQNVGNSNPPKVKRDEYQGMGGGTGEATNPCLLVTEWDWQCPAIEQTLLSVHQCSPNEDGVAGGGSPATNPSVNF